MFRPASGPGSAMNSWVAGRGLNCGKELTPDELVQIISDLDMEKLGMMDIRLIKPREGQPQRRPFYGKAVRNSLYDFFLVKQQVPTLKELLEAVKKELKFPGSSKSLRKLLRKDGFHVAHQHKKGKKHHSRKDKHCHCKSRKDGNAESQQDATTASNQ